MVFNETNDLLLDDVRRAGINLPVFHVLDADWDEAVSSFG